MRSAIGAVSLFLFFFLAGCETPPPPEYAVWENVNSSVQGIIKAYSTITPGLGIRGKSQNGREFVSRYFATSGDQYTDATNAKERAHTKISILGDRRPYTIHLQYIVEERNEDGNYTVVRLEKDKSQKLMKDLRTYLATRRERDNFIDDFRPF